jgi:hypothetical protein
MLTDHWPDLRPASLQVCYRKPAPPPPPPRRLPSLGWIRDPAYWVRLDLGGGAARRLGTLYSEGRPHRCPPYQKMGGAYVPHLQSVPASASSVMYRPPHYMGPQAHFAPDRGHNYGPSLLSGPPRGHGYPTPPDPIHGGFFHRVDKTHSESLSFGTPYRNPLSRDGNLRGRRTPTLPPRLLRPWGTHY